MRKGKQFVTGALVAIAFSGTAVAQSTYAASSGANGTTITYQAPALAMRDSVQNVVEALLADGFIYIEVRETFLGRARFIAYSAAKKREIVINPTTGEVLRDLLQESNGSQLNLAIAEAQVASNNGNGNGVGNSGNNGNSSGNNGNGGNSGGNGNGNGNGNGGGNNGNGNGNN